MELGVKNSVVIYGVVSQQHVTAVVTPFGAVASYRLPALPAELVDMAAALTIARTCPRGWSREAYAITMNLKRVYDGRL